MSSDVDTSSAKVFEEGIAGLRVLIADDTFITQTMMKVRLTRLGCDVTTVDNGQAAVAEAKRMRFDCIFMDYHMPVMDGAEATRAIRRWEAEQPETTPMPPKTYIVAFTATSQPADRAVLTTAGMDDFLPKPMKLPELLATLRRVAARK